MRFVGRPFKGRLTRGIKRAALLVSLGCVVFGASTRAQQPADVKTVHVQGSVYYSRFSSFIFQAPTGEIEENLPVYEYRQAKADYYGFELESDAKFGKACDGRQRTGLGDARLRMFALR